MMTKRVPRNSVVSTIPRTRACAPTLRGCPGSRTARRHRQTRHPASDQGFEHGPARSFALNPAAYDPRYHFQLAIDAGCNAYAAPLGFIEAGASEFAGELPLILKLNNQTSA